MAAPFAAPPGPALVRSPNPRRQAQRRRALAVAAFVALAVGSGLIGALSGPKAGANHPAVGPFSYFPAQ